MDKQYQALTDFIPSAARIAERQSARDIPLWDRGGAESRIVDRFVDTFYSWMSEHPETGLDYYRDILAENGLSTDILDKADTEKCGARCVLAMFFAAIRANRFSDGFLYGLFLDGTALKWLRRLEKLDR